MRARLALLTLAAATILSTSAGCSVRNPKPQIHRYILGPASPNTLTADRPPLQLGLVSGLTPFRDTEIAYQTTPYRLDVYTFSRWSGPPIELVSDRIAALLQTPPSGPRSSMPAMLLDSRIEAFQEVDDGEHVSGLVTINFCLRSQRAPSKAQWCQSISHQTGASANTREAAVAAITSSLNGVLDDLSIGLNRQFAALPEPSGQHRSE